MLLIILPFTFSRNYFRTIFYLKGLRGLQVEMGAARKYKHHFRLRRLNCVRFWLAKLNINNKSKLIMKETAEFILEMISAENRSLEQTNHGYYLTEEEMDHLVYMGRSMNPGNDEVVWMRFDRLLYGWISVQKFLIHKLEGTEIHLLRKCLASYHPSLRFDAFELLEKLMNKQPVNLLQLIQCDASFSS